MNKLDPKDYWEWRCSIEELNHEKTKVTLCEEVFRRMSLEMQVYKISKLSPRKASYDKIKQDYKTYLADLEERTGFDLGDSAIDPVTFEITSLK